MRLCSQRYREFGLRSAFAIFYITWFVLVAEGLFLCVFVSDHRWAKGWFGLDKHTLYTVAILGMNFLIFVTNAICLLSVPCSCLQILIRRECLGWGTFLLCVIVLAGIGAAVAIRSYPEARANAMQAWP